MKRPWLPVAVFLAAAMLLYLPIAFGASFWVKDVLRFTYLQKWYLRDRLLHGELPLWWAQIGLGRPFLGLVQPGVLYPGNIALLLPMPLGYDVFTALHGIIAMLGMRWWLRRVGEDELTASFGGLLFATSGYFVSLLTSNGVYAFGLAWIPAILAAAVPTPAPRARRIAVLALLIALCLSAGDPQAVFFAVMALTAQALARPRGERVSALVTLALGGALAAAIGLVLLVPGLEVASQGRPGGVPFEDAQHFTMHPARFLELVWPGMFGAPYTSTWFISPLVDEGLGGGYSPFDAGVYVGLATPVLALAAVVSKRRSRLDVGIGALLFLLFLICLGYYTPVFSAFFHFVPGAKMFRYPEKYFALASVCFAYLAARGLAVVVADPKRATRVGLVGVVALAIGALCAVLVGTKIILLLVPRLEHTGVTRAVAGAIFRDHTLFALGVGVACWLPVALAASGKLSSSRLRVILTALITCDLLIAAFPLIDWAPSSSYRARSPLLDSLPPTNVPDQPPLRLYRPEETLFGGESTPLMDRCTFLPNSGIEDGIDQLNAYDVFHTAAEETLWSTLRVHPLKLLQLTATSWALVDDASLGTLHPLMHVRARYPGLHASVVEVEGAAPRVYLAEHASVAASNKEAAQAMVGVDFVPGKNAVVEGGEPRAASGVCTLESFRPERVIVRCHASAPSYAVLADGAFPGWHATVDGNAAPILRANAAMRAVAVPAGDSLVELRYRPRGLTASAIASTLALLLALFLSRRRSANVAA
jgi:hypothetical protein